MFDAIQNLPLFIAAGVVLNLTPGVDMALVATRSAQHGFRGGALAALGIGAGCGVHTLAAALGVSALIAQSALAFDTLRWLGAAYLVWLGIGMWRRAGTAGAGQPPASAGETGPSAWAIFRQGFLTNALNPKVALFFLAFLPQFIAPQAADKTPAFVLLGLIFIINGTLVMVAFAAFVARLRRVVAPGSRQALWLQRAGGALFVALGARLALASRA
jgi:threonine/homoserine/homoserine lactone efflux protein